MQYMKLCDNYVIETYDDNGVIAGVEFDYPDNYNFGYDVVDEMGRLAPDQRAVVWCNVDKEERTFTFGDILRLSSKAANVFRNHGIGRGDKVLVILKRNYEYWYVAPALEKLGAVIIPATNLLNVEDLKYRINAADIKAMQGIEMMSEMINVLQAEMTAEMDRETIGRCKSLCTPKIYNKADANPTKYDGIIGRWSQERYSNIVTQIQKAANDIRTATRRGAANIAVVSPDMATVLQSAAPFFNKIQHDVNGSLVTPEIGTLNNSIKVYCDQYAVSEDGTTDNGEVLLAYKGSSLSDAGVVFCPYVTGVINQAVDPNDFSPRVGIMSRYGFATNMLGAENYYRLLKFNGLFSDGMSTDLVW